MVVKAGQTAKFSVSFIPPNPEKYQPFLLKGSADLTNADRVRLMEVTEKATVKHIDFRLFEVSLTDSGVYTIELVTLHDTAIVKFHLDVGRE